MVTPPVLIANDNYLFVDSFENDTICFSDKFGFKIHKIKLDLFNIITIALLRQNSLLIVGTVSGIYTYEVSVDEKYINRNSKNIIDENGHVSSFFVVDEDHFFVYEIKEGESHIISKYSYRQNTHSIHKIQEIDMITVNHDFTGNILVL